MKLYLLKSPTQGLLTKTHLIRIDELYIFGLENWQSIEKLYNEFNDNSLKNRDLQIWKPILVLAKFIDVELFHKLKNFAIKNTEIKTVDDISEGSFDHQLLSIFSNLVLEKANSLENREIILLKDIQNQWDGDKAPQSKTIARFLDKIGFRDKKEKTREGAGYRVTKTFFDSIIYTIFPSFASQQSQNTNFELENIKKSVMMCDDGDANKQKKNNSCDDGDGNDANDDETEISIVEESIITKSNSDDVVSDCDRVFSCVRSCNFEKGITFEVLAEKTGLPNNIIDDCLTKLVRDGDIFEKTPGFWGVL